MQLDNFEKQVQQKLSNREMKPSANSWDRLDAMLNVEEKPKKKGFFLINIAASFIVLASIGYYFYNQNEVLNPVKEETIIVEENSEFRIQNSENKEDNTENIESVKEVVVENNNLIKKNKNSSIGKQQVVIISETKNQKEVSIINQQITNNNQNVIAENNKTSNQNTEPTTPKYISAEKLLAEVNNTKYKNKNSEKEVKRTRKGISVNPNALLSNAETEIYQSFRESALEKLNKNFNSIKTVLANRNYEDEL
ncbi:hypothetical protein [uncultured Flavobacterium sp.]|uniref:hypothetical protein n=1 Tax=uncultured Flavobacterium sp. TaxID=165435 RepID=UPI0030C8B440